MPSEINVGGGGFQVGTSSGYQEIASGASGDVLVLSNVDNKDVRLDSLSSILTSTPFGELGITVNVDGVDLISGTLAGVQPLSAGTGAFAIQQTGAFSGSENTSSDNINNVGYISDVVGKVITVTKNTGSTANRISYSYSTGK